ncbi:N-acetylmuramic acid 6-phosphate etherase [Paenibacillus albiflavus]|uniref:N-acetylmuramic acid 6-phosphate etherase n=1 Tax=Paenibacillus albiflavus TaxID=2545760 RepID=A0A4R4EGX0_9BACL|nr:N-acetylmuramic acid 6-phosphate etherase [Paenibacillus albiflavus]TCZ77405.1 N-acetylmuramic acid 6-phosphate etherase [Paenibacillus albiflavus]
MDLTISKLVTEQRNENTQHIDELSTIDVLKLINEEDSIIPGVIAECLPDIALATDAIIQSFKDGGRLFYYGAGTSGRLGILDASECPPTYGTDPEQVQGIIAGGKTAILRAVEGAEDSRELGSSDVDTAAITSKDVVVGIAASGRTPYVLGVMERAKELGATVVGLSNNKDTQMKAVADIMIEAVVGPEVVLGSTRMKAGTAVKMILNMLSTTAMIRSGKVYENLMVDLQASNYKLIERGKRLITLATGASREVVDRVYAQSNGHIKSAIVMILADISFEDAQLRLNQTGGFVREAIQANSLSEQLI